MNTKKWKWGNRQWEYYNPTVNRKRQAGLLSLMVGDIILPATFGIGFIITRQILKIKPLFLYQ